MRFALISYKIDVQIVDNLLEIPDIQVKQNSHYY